MVSNRRLALVFALFMGILHAEQVEVTADEFFADENKLISTLTGNVVVKKGKDDTLTANKVDIYFNKDKQPIKYVATGNAKFKGILKKNHYDGSGDVLTYEPNSNLYTLSGNAYLHEKENKRKVWGDTIIVNQNSGTYEVKSQKSGKKPAKFIFQIEDKNK